MDQLAELILPAIFKLLHLLVRGDRRAWLVVVALAVGTTAYIAAAADPTYSFLGALILSGLPAILLGGYALLGRLSAGEKLPTPAALPVSQNAKLRKILATKPAESTATKPPLHPSGESSDQSAAQLGSVNPPINNSLLTHSLGLHFLTGVAITVGYFLSYQLFVQTAQASLLADVTDYGYKRLASAFAASFQCFCPVPIAVGVGLLLSPFRQIPMMLPTAKRRLAWLVRPVFGFVIGFGAYIPLQILMWTSLAFSG